MEKNIPGFEDYIIDDNANIYSLKSRRCEKGERYKLNPYADRKGYLSVKLWDKSGRRKRFFVHRLVAMCFIKNPNHYGFINHKDRDHKNNSVSNLEWCTMEYNNTYTFTVGPPMKGEKCHLYKNNELIGEFCSIRQAVRFAVSTDDKISPNSLFLYLKCKDFKIVRDGIDTKDYCEKWKRPYDSSVTLETNFSLYFSGEKIRKFFRLKDAIDFASKNFDVNVCDLKRNRESNNCKIIKE